MGLYLSPKMEEKGKKGKSFQTLTHDGLAISMGHEIRRLLHGLDTSRATALTNTVLPTTVVVVRVVRCIRRLTVGVKRIVSRRLGVSAAVLSCGLSEPLVVASVARGGRHGVLGSAIARIRGSKRRVPRVVGPGGLARAVGVLLGLHGLVALVLCDLSLNVARVRRAAVAVVPGQVGIDGRDQSSQALAARLGGSSLLHLLPLTPVVEPGLIVLAFIKVDVEAPVHGRKPIILQSVQLRDGNTANLRPGSVLKGVVVQEFATEEERNGEESPNLTLGGLVRTLALHGVDSLGEIVHSKKNGRTGQSRGGEDLRHELPEGRGDASLGGNNASSHLGDILSHHVDLIIEDGTNASGHDDG